MPAAMVTNGWALDDAPKLDGKVAIVTGATGGLGFETALGLARQGATTVLAGRHAAKGAQALARIQSHAPNSKIRFEILDLASLASVARFANGVMVTHGGVIDILVNNAAVMGLPRRVVTEDGFEHQVGVNYLAHFALTARLRQALRAASGGGRIINVASLAHRRSRLNLDEFQSERVYRPMEAYGQSKLAMLMFSLELQRRAARGRWNLLSLAVHPGWARTDIIANGMGAGGHSLKVRTIETVFALLAQPVRDAALPSLYAAMAPDARAGAYYGPIGLGETRGVPGLARISAQAMDQDAARLLWAMSERLTGITFD